MFFLLKRTATEEVLIEKVSKEGVCVYYMIRKYCMLSPLKMQRLFVSIDTTLINRFIRKIVKNEVRHVVVYHNRMFALFQREMLFIK